MKKTNLLLTFLFILGIFNLKAQNNPCTNFEVNFTYNETSPGVVSFTENGEYIGNNYYTYWSFGDGGPTQYNINNPTHTFEDPGTYLVCFYASYQDNQTFCYDSICMNITVGQNNPCNNVTADFQYDNGPNGSNSLSFGADYVGDANYTQYYWDFGDGSTEQGYLPFPDHTYSQTGSYTVCLYINYQDAQNFCDDTICQTIQIGSSNGCENMEAYFEITYGNALGVLVNGNASQLGNNTQTSIDFGDGTIINGSLYEDHGYAVPGTYEICLSLVEMDSSCNLECVKNFCQEVTVPSDSLGCNTTDCLNSHNISFSTYDSGGVYLTPSIISLGLSNFEFTGINIFIDSSFHTSSNNPNNEIYLDLPVGSYEICMEVWFANENDPNCVCSQTYCNTVNVLTGMNQTENFSTGFIVFPNPTTQQLQIQIKNQEQPMSLNIKNSLGQTVLSKQNIQPTQSIDVQHLATGTYNIEFFSTMNNQVLGNKTFIKH